MTNFAEQIRDVIHQADLTGEEAASIFGVSRQMVYKWIDGIGPHRAKVLARVNVALPTLRAAIDRKILPLPRLNKHERLARVQSMVEVISKLVQG